MDQPIIAQAEIVSRTTTGDLRLTVCGTSDTICCEWQGLQPCQGNRGVTPHACSVGPLGDPLQRQSYVLDIAVGSLAQGRQDLVVFVDDGIFFPIGTTRITQASLDSLGALFQSLQLCFEFLLDFRQVSIAH